MKVVVRHERIRRLAKKIEQAVILNRFEIVGFENSPWQAEPCLRLVFHRMLPDVQIRDEHPKLFRFRLARPAKDDDIPHQIPHPGVAASRIGNDELIVAPQRLETLGGDRHVHDVWFRASQA